MCVCVSLSHSGRTSCPLELYLLACGHNNLQNVLSLSHLTLSSAAGDDFGPAEPSAKPMPIPVFSMWLYYYIMAKKTRKPTRETQGVETLHDY